MPWIAVSLRIKPEFADILGEALISRGSAGVWEPEPGVLTAYFPLQTDPRAVRSLIEEVGLSVAEGAVALSDVPDQDWIATWKASVTPLRVTPRLVIVPSWREYRAGPDEQTVILDPEMAFGTGHHETTRLCLELLDERLRRASVSSMLDVGTGSGILAIAAAKLGADRVVACDIDPLACETATRNIATNAVAPRVAVRDPEETMRQGPYDVITANLTADDLISLMPQLVAALAPGGDAVLSGILLTRESDVAEAMAVHRVSTAERRTAGEWVALRVRR